MKIITPLTAPTLFARCPFLKTLFSSALVVWKISPSYCGDRGGWKQAALYHRSACKCASFLVLGETKVKKAANKRPRCSRSERIWWVEDSRPEDKSYDNLSAPLSSGSSRTLETQAENRLVSEESASVLLQGSALQPFLKGFQNFYQFGFTLFKKGCSLNKGTVFSYGVTFSECHDGQEQ